MDIEVDPLQLKTLKVHSHAVISSLHLGLEIYVDVDSIDTKKNIIRCIYKNNIESYVHQRKTARVEPIIGSHISLTKNNAKGFIINISKDHLLCKANGYFKLFDMHEDFDFFIDCRIPDFISHIQNYKIKAKGFIKEKISSQTGDKILIKFALSQEDKEILIQYINYRNKESIVELKKTLSS